MADASDVAPYTATAVPSTRPQIDFRPVDVDGGFLGKPDTADHVDAAIAALVAGAPVVENFCSPTASSPTNIVVVDANHRLFVLLDTPTVTAAGVTAAVVAVAAVPTNDTADDVVSHRPGPSIGWLNSKAACRLPAGRIVVAVATPVAAK